MQISITENQRAFLLTPFLDQFLTPDNEFVEYIESSNGLVTPKHNNTKSSNITTSRSNIMTVQNKNIENLKKSKTKFDIAVALDYLIPNQHYRLLVDTLPKSYLVAKKEEFIRNHVTSV